MRLAVGSDHGGRRLKEHLAEHLKKAGHEVVDVGTYTDDSCDYPDYAEKVARMVASMEVARGVLICGTGLGMSIAANKVAGVRAAVVSDAFSARMASEHNDARVLCMGERVIGFSLAETCLDAWLSAQFEGGRHGRRVGKMAVLDGSAED